MNALKIKTGSRLALAVVTALASLPLYAMALSESLALNGFASVGAVYNSDDDAVYVRNVAQPGRGIDTLSYQLDTRAGVQLNYRANEQLSGGIQLLSRYRYDESFTPELSWAYLKYRLLPEAELRLGRLGLDIFFRSDSRDIGYSYLWVRPPVDYYGVINVSRFDGVDLSQYLSLKQGVFKVKGFYGLANQKFPGFNANQLDFSDSPLYGLLAEYQGIDWFYKLTLSGLKLNDEDPSITQLSQIVANGNQTLAEQLAMRDKTLRYYSFGVGYEKGRWRVQSALGRIESETLAISDNLSAYISLGYRLQRWTPYFMVSGVRSESVTPVSVAPELDPLIAMAVAEGELDQRTLSIGGRYDLSDTIALKLQFDRVKSAIKPSLLWYVDDLERWDQENSISSIVIDMVF
ncbi:porin [Ectothiorhodospiraceae bacterium BW-2]|nr:porin [Ectothiorhodospiraceae bacterium BW-2]